MNILDLDVLKNYIRACNDGWELDWHERNGGNLTYLMSAEEVAACRPYFKDAPGEWVRMDVQADNLKNAFFLSTGSGKYFRNMVLAPQDNICILEINDAGDSWRIVWGLEKGGKPTSEFPSHFLNHSVRLRATDGKNRVIYHAHPANIIAMTYILPLTHRAFSRALWQSATECPVVFPQGVGVVEWMVPGGRDIALATSKLMQEFPAAVWAHHGLFVSGQDLDEAFGLMHTIEKAAQIYMLVTSSGHPVMQTISDDAMRAIANDFGLTLREEFLD